MAFKRVLKRVRRAIKLVRKIDQHADDLVAMETTMKAHLEAAGETEPTVVIAVDKLGRWFRLLGPIFKLARKLARAIPG